ncbi:hypothetical protein VTK56DRAFT_9419 [Thermocarpiscus australiensis]
MSSPVILGEDQIGMKFKWRIQRRMTPQMTVTIFSRKPVRRRGTEPLCPSLWFRPITYMYAYTYLRYVRCGLVCLR